MRPGVSWRKSLDSIWTQLAMAVAVIATGAILGWSSVVYPSVGGLVVVAFGASTLVWFGWNHPAPAMVLLVALLPFYQHISAVLWTLGIPVGLLSTARYWKELLLLTLAIRLVMNGFRPRDALDWLVISFIALTIAYSAVPAASGGASLLERILAARADAGYLLLFLIARHLTLPGWLPNWLQGTLLLAGAVMSGLALWNHFDPTGWGNWVNSMRLVQYQVAVLGANPPAVVDYSTFAGQPFLRAGSLFFTPLTLAHFLVIPVAIGVALAAAGRATSWRLMAAALCTAGLLVTVTRSVIVTLPLILGVALMVGRRRMRMAAVLIVGTIALFPLAGSLRLGEHISQAGNPTSGSTAGHLSALSQDMEFVFRNPLGTGISTAGPTNQRFRSGGITAESWYFQIGVELGFAGLALYVGILALVFRGAFRAARSGSQHAAGTLCALSALAFGSLFLHVFNDLSVSWSMWLLAGLACAQPVTAKVAAVAAAVRQPTAA